MQQSQHHVITIFFVLKKRSNDFFYGGSGCRAVAHTHPAVSKNALGPVGIPLIRGASGAGR